MRKIVLGYDGSDSARRALERAGGLAEGAPVTVVSAVRWIAGKGGMPFDPVEEEDHRRHLEEARDRLSELGVDSSLVEGHGDAAKVIVAEAENVGANLIVVGSEHKNLLERLLLGSVSTDVLHRAHTEVLVVP